MSVKNNIEQWIAQLDYDDTCDISDRQVSELIRNYAALEDKCQAMAAENVTMKQIIDSVTDLRNEPKYHADGMGCGLEDRDITNRYDAMRYGWDEAMERIYGEVIPCAEEIAFPETSAFLAEVRAQVWIEGNEPADFGRYWVRYETDVGPQYCSAKWMEHNFCAGSDTNIHKIWLADHSRSINSLKGVTHYTMLPEPIEGGAK